MEKNLKTISDIYRYSTKEFNDKIWSFCADKELSYTYGQFANKCEEISELLYSYGIGAGDAVAIYSSSTPHWSLAFFIATAFGRVSVPILRDFTGVEAEHVLKHSESRVLFVGKQQLSRLSEECLSSLDLVFDIDSLEIIRSNACGKINKERHEPQPNDLAALIYTSGTTGQAKGVMLTHINFVTNIIAGFDIHTLGTKDTLLSILPLAHTYELSLGMLYPFTCGSRVCYISKAPTPSYLVKVMAQVHPTAMLTVPLIIEKVYKGQILPTIKKSPVLRWMDRNMNSLLCRIVGRELVKKFGGKMRFFGIGGAKLDVDVETFLNKARFPYYIGYGLTECAPLLTISSYKDTIPGSIGIPITGVELRLNNINKATGEGEIVARGNNIMPGYYKDPERTAEAFTEDGWFRTKDIAIVDSKGRYTIKGRLGNMILGANGENIYPEEIEKVIAEFQDVEESIVISRDNRLLALVKVNSDVLNLSSEILDDKMKAIVESYKKKLLEFVNARVNVNSKIQSVELMTQPFIKTATLKIRRFLYAKDAPSV